MSITTPAMNTPKRAARKLFFLSKPNSTARKHPVQAPLPGSGIATKSIMPQKPYFSIVLFFFKVFSLSREIKWPNFLKRDRKFRIASIMNRTKGITSTLAAMHTKNALKGEMFNNEAAMRPPRSSKIGRSEIMKIRQYFPNMLPVMPAKMPKIPSINRLVINSLLY